MALSVQCFRIHSASPAQKGSNSSGRATRRQKGYEGVVTDDRLSYDDDDDELDEEEMPAPFVQGPDAARQAEPPAMPTLRPVAEPAAEQAVEVVHAPPPARAVTNMLD